MTDAVLFNGAVKSRISDLPDEAWVFSSGGGAAGKEQEYYQAVPWIYRGVGLRADAIGSLPFAIMRGETEIDTSGNYQNAVGFLPDPVRLLGLIEAALVCLGKAYAFHGYNLVKTVEMRYLAPTSLKPIWDENTGELLGFKRQIGTRQIRLDPEDVIRFWLADPFVEMGPPKAWALKAALMAAGVLFNVDEFAAAFFERGGIKATVLSAEGMRAGSLEAKKLKSWWRRLMTGINNAFASEVMGTEVKATVIGEGIKELENTDLTQEKREDISTALGIPQTLLFSNAANYATAQEDRLSFYQETIVPEARFIESVLNEQVFKPNGYRWQFRPETLDVFQNDEQKRSTAFLNYVNAKLPIEVVGPMLGLELPPGYTWEQLAVEREDRYQDMQQNLQGSGGGFAENAGDEDVADEAKALMLADLRKWRKKAAKKDGLVSFESEHIPSSLYKVIAGALERARTPEEIRAAFSLATPITGPEEINHSPVTAYLICPSCGHGEADQYADHGGLAVCKSCGVTFDPAVMI